MDIKTIEAAVLQLVTTPINNALTSLQTTPTVANAAAQFAMLQVELITALPALEQLGIKDGAAIIQEKLNGYVASLTVSKA
jgi:hypothetical protein